MTKILSLTIAGLITAASPAAWAASTENMTEKEAMIALDAAFDESFAILAKEVARVAAPLSQLEDSLNSSSMIVIGSSDESIDAPSAEAARRELRERVFGLAERTSPREALKEIRRGSPRWLCYGKKALGLVMIPAGFVAAMAGAFGIGAEGVDTRGRLISVGLLIGGSGLSFGGMTLAIDTSCSSSD